jgi:hypothetical protein
MNKPGPSDPVEQHLIYGMAQIDNERKTTCIHCGDEWYAIHYKDGVCHSCQEKGLTGKSDLLEELSLIKIALFVAGLVGFLYIAFG